MKIMDKKSIRRKTIGAGIRLGLANLRGPSALILLAGILRNDRFIAINMPLQSLLTFFGE